MKYSLKSKFNESVFMTYSNKVALVLGSYLLVACTTEPTLPNVPTVGAANNAGGTYTIVTDGVTHTMSGALTVGGGGTELNWYGGAPAETMKGSGYATADVLALAAMNKTGANETFAGITGTLGTVPTSGTATYNTRPIVHLLEPTGASNYFLIMPVAVDFDASTLSGSSSFSSTLQGDIVGNEFTGTFSSKGLVNSTVTTVPMQGGFYGANGGTIAGAFAGTGMAGVFGGPLAP